MSRSPPLCPTALLAARDGSDDFAALDPKAGEQRCMRLGEDGAFADFADTAVAAPAAVR